MKAASLPDDNDPDAGSPALQSSSSMARAQSSASRLRRKVLMVSGKPVFRMTAFHVPQSVLTMVSIGAFQSAAPQHCTGTVRGGSF
jgi:hypothetical protein